MEHIPFNVTARTAMLIGRENVNNAKSAVIELVKNTYDADSDYCLLLFTSEKSDEIDTVYIVDNGEGMNREIIVDFWMTIGTDNKQYEYMTENGRVKSGAKGIGRFALDRLGSKASVITKRKNDNTYVWGVNWSNFETGSKHINDVNASLVKISDNLFKREMNKLVNKMNKIERRKLLKLNDESGTIIRISNLRDTWDNDFIEDIFNTLNTLIPPKNVSDFNLFMYVDNSEKSYGRIMGEIADDYDYRVRAEYYNNESIKIILNRNEFEYEKFPEKVLKSKEFTSDEYLNKAHFLNKPIVYYKKVSDLMKMKSLNINIKEILNGFTCEVNFLKRGQSSHDRSKYCTKDISNKKRAAWLDIYGGVKLFRDSFKVRPYGEVNTNGFDWLDLGSRVLKSPAAPSSIKGPWRVRSNQVQGVVNISRTTNQLFKDQANREGIQDSDEFTFFKQLLVNIIGEFENDRQKVYSILNREHEEDTSETKHKGQKVASKIKKESTKNNNIDKDTVLLAETVNIISDENEELRDEIRTLQALATTGLIINTLSHEIKDNRVLINTRIMKSIDILEKKELSTSNWEKLNRHINTVNDKYKSLNEMFTMTLDVIKKDKRRRKAASLKKFVNDVGKSWLSILELRKISFNIIFMDEFEEYRLKFFVSDLETILNNLIINSIEAFEDEKLQIESREIKMKVDESETHYLFTYLDNGPGLSNSITDNQVFTPHETTKKDKRTGESIGTGLGMWIVNSIINEYNGECKLIRKSGGFGCEFSLKKNLRRRK